MGLAKLPAGSVMVFHQCLILARRARTILKSKEVLNQQEAEKITVFFFFWIACLFLCTVCWLIGLVVCFSGSTGWFKQLSVIYHFSPKTNQKPR